MPQFRILLVDDEETLLQLMCTILMRHGYETGACKDGAGAKVAFADAAQPWDMAIVDQSLPDANGADLAQWMAEQPGETKFLICSGWPFDLQTLPAGIRQRFAAIQKPFLPAELMCAVRNLLGC